MDKFWFHIVVIIICAGLFFEVKASDGLEEVRDQFHLIDNEYDLQKVTQLSKAHKNNPNSHVLKAYHGVCISMMAEYKFSPLSKLKLFNEGTDLIEYSIESNRNVENVYLRLLVQLSVPKILNYSSEIKADVDYLIQNLPQSDLSDEDQKRMVRTLLETKNTEVDLNSLKNIYFG